MILDVIYAGGIDQRYHAHRIRWDRHGHELVLSQANGYTERLSLGNVVTWEVLTDAT